MIWKPEEMGVGTYKASREFCNPVPEMTRSHLVSLSDSMVVVEKDEGREG